MEKPTLRHAVKGGRVTVQGPVKKSQKDFLSHSGGNVEPCVPPPSQQVPDNCLHR